MFRFLYLLILYLINLGCQGDTVSPDDTMPKNLTVEVIVSEDGSGKVDILAQAENVVEYRFYPGDLNADEFISNTGGSFSYNYSKSGSYNLEVRAYGSSGMFLKKVKKLTVQVGDDDGTIDLNKGYMTPLTYDGMNLIWGDEFEGTSLNNSKWSYELGDGCPNLCGWGNNELEFYKRENGIVKEGVVILEVKKEKFQNSDYTSARIKTQNKFSFKYGRIDIRAVLPRGQGMWPAFWMLGNNISSVGWPACGEVDIMEMVGGKGRENTVHGNARWDQSGLTDKSGSYVLESGTFADEYHVYSLVWNEESISWYVDDVRYHTVSILDPDMSEFHQEYFIILNLAIGGDWPGNPDATTVFPQRMAVDYIRVFQKS